MPARAGTYPQMTGDWHLVLSRDGTVLARDRRRSGIVGWHPARGISTMSPGDLKEAG